jgi:hypothetical protein
MSTPERPTVSYEPWFLTPTVPDVATRGQNRLLAVACNWVAEIGSELEMPSDDIPRLLVRRAGLHAAADRVGFSLHVPVPKHKGCGSLAFYSLDLDMRTGEDFGSKGAGAYNVLGLPRTGPRLGGKEVAQLTRVISLELPPVFWPACAAFGETNGRDALVVPTMASLAVRPADPPPAS